MINVDDWAEIRRLYFAERLGIKTISRQLGVARNTVRTAVRGSAPPDYKRGARGSSGHAVTHPSRYSRRIDPNLGDDQRLIAQANRSRSGRAAEQ